jgi:hypothetical protein
MRILQNRLEGLENEYFYRSNIAFSLACIKVRTFATDLADAMGKNPTEIEQYAANLVDMYTERGSEAAVLDRALCDLAEIGIYEHRAELEGRLRTAEAEAENKLFGLTAALV